jgi:LysR family transcriptional regulator, low CO2-responsive transcriptional regulator
MNAHQLRVFHAIARTGSFSGAAAHLALTQPAVSDHIRKLEEAYGVRLFTRGPRGATLTDVGRKLMAVAERLLEAEGEADQLLSRAGALKEGTLVIGADAAIHALPAVRHFRAAYPGIAIRIEAGNSSVLAARLRAFEVDFAIVARLPEGGDIVSRLIRRDPIVAILPKAWANRVHGKAGPKDMAQFPLVMREEGSATRELALRILGQSGTRNTATIEVSGRETCLEAVAQGMGVAYVSRGEVSSDPRIAVRELSSKEERMTEHLIYLRTRMNLRMVQAFLSSIDATTGAPLSA